MAFSLITTLLKCLFRAHGATTCLVSVVCLMCLLVLPLAHAMVPIDSQSIDLALRYGMESRGRGLKSFLNHNLQVQQGVMVNIYSPFIVIAQKTFRSDYPRNPTQQDIEDARKRYGKFVHYFKDKQNEPRFHVSYYISVAGDRPDFAKFYSVYIEGFGRGKAFSLKPMQVIRPIEAKASNIGGEKKYETEITAKFRYKDVVNLDEYTLYIVKNDGLGEKAQALETVSFKIDNRKCY